MLSGYVKQYDFPFGGRWLRPAGGFPSRPMCSPMAFLNLFNSRASGPCVQKMNTRVSVVMGHNSVITIFPVQCDVSSNYHYSFISLTCLRFSQVNDVWSLY